MALGYSCGDFLAPYKQRTATVTFLDTTNTQCGGWQARGKEESSGLIQHKYHL